MKENTLGQSLTGREWGVSSDSNLYRSLKRATDINHLALLYESREESLDASLTFLEIGFEADQRCLYVRSESETRAEIIEGLDALGVDTEAKLASDQLRIVPATEFYLFGEFEADEMVSSLIDMVTDTTADGHAGLRITGEANWHREPEIGFEDVLEYERSFDATAPNFEFSALCRYDTRRLTDEELLDIVQVHPRFIYHRQLCDNPFYRDPKSYENEDSPRLSAADVLQTAQKLTNARAEIDKREQRVGVLNRVLRHNLRNDVNVVQSHAELIADATDETAVLESTTTIQDATDRLMTIAESAKRVEKSVGNAGTSRVPVDLSRAIDHAAASARDRHPDVAIMSTVDDATWVESSAELDFALTELFETLATLADAEAKIVAEIDEACSTNSRRCLVVRCEGAALPKSEIQALTQGRETQLSHGNGLGLWLVNWVVELSGGSLSFETNNGREQVVLDLVAA